ncbi:MAG: leucine-rich repeat domain-containing protein [Oscillospiraceae bacterium]|nr:leucine-rich repeat domain-containing protein [Oscillospiraceae bacterium]
MKNKKLIKKFIPTVVIGGLVISSLPVYVFASAGEKMEGGNKDYFGDIEYNENDDSYVEEERKRGSDEVNLEESYEEKRNPSFISASAPQSRMMLTSGLSPIERKPKKDPRMEINQTGIKKDNIEYIKKIIDSKIANGIQHTSFLNYDITKTPEGKDVVKSDKIRKINKIVLSDKVEKIAPDAFKYEDIEEVVISGSVKEIGARAFYHCENLKRVIIGDGVKCIKANAFNGCVALKEIIIPDSVETIESNAFKDCIWLKKVVMGGIKKISSTAFVNCRNLTITVANMSEIEVEVEGMEEVGRGIKKISSTAFVNCRNLTITVANMSEIEVEEMEEEEMEEVVKSNIYYDEGNGLIYRLNDDGTAEVIDCYDAGSTTIEVPATIKHEDIPYAITKIGDRAFTQFLKKTKDMEIVLPESVKKIGDNILLFGTIKLRHRLGVEIEIGSNLDNVEILSFGERYDIDTEIRGEDGKTKKILVVKGKQTVVSQTTESEEI